MRTLGVEEELLVVDWSGTPVPRGPEALEVAARRGEGETVAEHDRADAADDDADDADDDNRGAAGEKSGSDGHLVPELKAQQIELGTSVCSTLDEVSDGLRYWRSRAEAAANAVDARVAALASSPVAVEPVGTPGQRYAEMAETFALTALEQLTCGCHVHVQVADEEEGVAVLNRIRVWLPVLTALTANSPFWSGRDSGYASFRSQAWNRWPSAGPTGLFEDAAHYGRVVEDLVATRTIVDSGMIYFDARLSEQWPTVEIRVADVALRVEDAVTHAGLVRGLVETAAREWRAGAPAPDVRTEQIRVAAWRAGRSGLDDDLISPVDGRPAPAGEVVAALLAHIRSALVDAGDDARVADGVAAILDRGNGARLQRRVYAETGDPAAVVRAAVDVTAGA